MVHVAMHLGGTGMIILRLAHLKFMALLVMHLRSSCDIPLSHRKCHDAANANNCRLINSVVDVDPVCVRLRIVYCPMSHTLQGDCEDPGFPSLRGMVYR